MQCKLTYSIEARDRVFSNLKTTEISELISDAPGRTERIIDCREKS